VVFGVIFGVVFEVALEVAVTVASGVRLGRDVNTKKLKGSNNLARIHGPAKGKLLFSFDGL
jgi:hypothetical protein